MINEKMSNEAYNGNFAKRLLAAVSLLIWSLTTIILTVTIIGVLVLIALGSEDDGWYSLPRKCIDTIIH